MKENLKMINLRALGLQLIPTETDMRENGKIINNMEEEH